MKTKLYNVEIRSSKKSIYLQGGLLLQVENVYATSHKDAKHKAWFQFRCFDIGEMWGKLLTREDVKIESWDYSEFESQGTESAGIKFTADFIAQ